MICNPITMTCVFLVAIVVGFCLAVCVHEAGHLLGGYITNYNFVTLAVFGISIYKRGGKYRLKVRKDLGLGVCFMRPKSLQQKPYVLIAGGIAANMLLSVVAFISGIFAGSLYAMTASVCVGGINLMMGIYNAVPHSPSNDGTSLKEVLRGPKYVQIYNRIMMIYYEEENETRPEEMDAELFFIPEGTDGALADELRVYGEMIK